MKRETVRSTTKRKLYVSVYAYGVSISRQENREVRGSPKKDTEKETLQNFLYAFIR